MPHLSYENPSDPGIDEPGDARPTGPASGGSTLEWVLRSLLRVREREEAERAVVDLVCAAATARWAALFAESEGSFRLRRCSPESHQPPGEAIPLEVVEPLLTGRRIPVLCPEGAELRAFGGADTAALAPVELSEGASAFFLLGPRLGGEPYRREDLALLQSVADAGSVALQNAELIERLRSQAYLDFLTGCYNRRGFESQLRAEIGRARRYERPLSLLLLDVDHFKWVNDSMGHPAGDYALRRLGSLLLGAFRTTDWVCRFGGDEFAVVFPETPKDEVARLADRIRLQVAGLFPDQTIRRGITASLGVAAFPGDGQEPDEILQSADRALYRAKSSGRNRVVIA